MNFTLNPQRGSLRNIKGEPTFALFGKSLHVPQAINKFAITAKKVSTAFLSSCQLSKIFHAAAASIPVESPCAMMTDGGLDVIAASTCIATGALPQVSAGT